MADRLTAAVESWDRRGWPRPQVALVSGSGLAVGLPGSSGRKLPLGEILPFPVHSVIGHPHEVEVLEPQGSGVVFYQRGRVHSYQGYDAAQTVFAVRLGALLGAHTLIMTNAAGATDAARRPGELMLIGDHINLTGLNPLSGELPDAWGPRFPDLVDAYDPALRELARGVAGEIGLELDTGVYAGLAGPSYETPAEVRMLRLLGADLVGMSTVLEVIAARHMGVRCLCLSLVSNLAAGTATGPLHHDEVLAAGREAAGRVQQLLAALLLRPELYSRETGKD